MNYHRTKYGHYYYLGKERFRGENSGYYYLGHLKRLFWTNGNRILYFGQDYNNTVINEIEKES